MSRPVLFLGTLAVTAAALVAVISLKATGAAAAEQRAGTSAPISFQLGCLFLRDEATQRRRLVVPEGRRLEIRYVSVRARLRLRERPLQLSFTTIAPFSNRVIPVTHHVPVTFAGRDGPVMKYLGSEPMIAFAEGRAIDLRCRRTVNRGARPATVESLRGTAEVLFAFSGVLHDVADAGQ